eukprot:1898345-Amphidinium_carterae.1
MNRFVYAGLVASAAAIYNVHTVESTFGHYIEVLAIAQRRASCSTTFSIHRPQTLFHEGTCNRVAASRVTDDITSLRAITLSQSS